MTGVAGKGKSTGPWLACSCLQLGSFLTSEQVGRRVLLRVVREYLLCYRHFLLAVDAPEPLRRRAGVEDLLDVRQHLRVTDRANAPDVVKDLRVDLDAADVEVPRDLQVDLAVLQSFLQLSIFEVEQVLEVRRFVNLTSGVPLEVLTTGT